MALATIQRPVRPRKEEDEEYFETTGVTSEEDDASSASGQEDQDALEDFDDESNSYPGLETQDRDNDATSDDEADDLKDISFGALAKAQAAFAPNPRKRKLHQSLLAQDGETVHPSRSDRSKHGDASHPTPKKPKTTASRSSKHAPAVQSSRHAVSRRRDIFDEPASLKSRDPRFDPTVTASNSNASAVEKANKNYSFLSAYQASEILDLKAQIKKSKDPGVVAALKRQVMSLDSKMRVAEAQQREREIIKRHKQKEKEAIKSGQKSKPYFLKRSDVKKEALAERFNSMGKKARDKAMERKRKRIKGKESKDMPRARRGRVPRES